MDFTWQIPTLPPVTVPVNSQTDWSVSDQLEVDSENASWSVIHGTAAISVINGPIPNFISVSGTTITFNPTVAGTYTYTVK